MKIIPNFFTGFVSSKKDSSLEEIFFLLKVLKIPLSSLPPIIHIAGTNGKGSSVAFLKSIFMSAGYKVHTYTSPHLLEVNERIVLRGEKISDEYLLYICEKTRIACFENKITLTFFEALTVSAFLAFSEIQADVLIVETGLGGRIDATNIVTPLITMITPISYDHVEFLGGSLENIAKEKAGIIKYKVPCVISCQVDSIYNILFDRCFQMQSQSFCYEHDFFVKKDIHDFKYISSCYNETFPIPSLLGDHQILNAASVIATVGLINNKYYINKKQIKDGLKKVIWPSRIEKIEPMRYKHLFGSCLKIWIDGAHNSSGSQALTTWIRGNFQEKVFLILGMTRNRDVESFCYYFKGLTVKAFSVRVLSEVSSYDPETLSCKAGNVGLELYPAQSLEEALRSIAEFNNVDSNVIITGSLFLFSDLISLID